MGKLTLHNQDDIDRDIRQDLDHIINSIASGNFDYFSIYLIGAFGRGEGTVKFDGQRWRAVNDYDLLVIAQNCEKIGPFLKTLSNKLAQSLEVDFVDLGCVQRSSLPYLECTIQNYDFKYASKLIAGEDVLNEVPQFRPEAIAPYEIVRLICNRAAGLLSAYLPENAGSPHYYANQCMKACIAVGDAAVYLDRGYHHLYETRLEMFCSLAANEGLPFSLPPKGIDSVIEAYERKLEGLHSAAFSIDEVLMKSIIGEVYCAITRHCTNKATYNVAQAERELLKHFKNKKSCKNIMNKSIEILRSKNISNIFEIKNRILFAQPFFYCDSSLSKMHLVKETFRRFWMIPHVFRYISNPYAPVMLWSRFHH
jgi:hypothetical protein